MKTYHNTVVLKFDDELTGNAGSGLLVTVRASDTKIKANIFDLSGAPIDNPLTTDDNGNYEFKVADGIYDVITKEGTNNEITLAEVEIVEGINNVKFFDTIAIAITDSGLVDGDSVYLKERVLGNGGGSMWNVVLTSTVTPNTFDIVVSTGTPTLSLVLNDTSPLDITTLGALKDNSSDALAALDHAISISDNIYAPSGTYAVDSRFRVEGDWQGKFTGDGNTTIFDFTNSTDDDDFHLRFVTRSVWKDFSIKGRTARASKGIRLGDDVSGNVASANTFYNVKVTRCSAGIYGEGGVTNRFFNCETSSCTEGITLTAQSNVYLFSGHYLLQCDKWFTITKSNASFIEPTFQRIINPVDGYAFTVSDSEVIWTGGYVEKQEINTAIGLIQTTDTSDALVGAFTWNGGHITPDGNSRFDYDSSPTVNISGVNNAISPDDSTGIVISRLNSSTGVLFQPTLNVSAAVTAQRKNTLIKEFQYGNEFNQSGVNSVSTENAIVQGTFFDSTVTEDNFYTLVIVAKHSTDVAADTRFLFEQLLSSVRVERQPLEKVPLSTDDWKVFYVPFIARGDEIQLETISSELLWIKSIQLYDGTYFPTVDSEREQKLESSSIPVAGSFNEGDKVKKKTVTVDGNDMVLANWLRITTGSGHVLNTDWAPQYISTVSPAT